MNRRDLLAVAGAALAMQKAKFAFGKNIAFDRFGGWTRKRFEATGFFRVEKQDRWWLVTPEGNAFLSFGINHLYPDLFNQDYNRANWQKKLGVQKLQGKQYFSALRNWFLETCTQYGFNTVGVHNALQVVNEPTAQIPYMRPIRFVDIPHWKKEIPDENFLDIFSRDFEEHCDKLAREAALPAKDDPFLLAYSMTDCPLFTEEDCRERTDVIGGARREARIGWPRRLRNLGSEAAGKRAYVECMREVYRNSIEEFNRTYGASFSNFEALAATSNWRKQTDLSNGNETRDNIEFLKKCVAQYYRVAKMAIQKYDPNHLFVGDKINANTDTLDTVLPVINEYVDIIFYQMYARYEVQKPGLDRWSAITDKPFMNGDSAFTMITDTMPRPYGPVADNLDQRAEWTAEFFQRAFARPEFVGWHYCGLIDASQQVTRKQDRQHSGLLDGFGNPYAQVQQVLKEGSHQLYDIATT